MCAHEQEVEYRCIRTLELLHHQGQVIGDEADPLELHNEGVLVDAEVLVVVYLAHYLLGVLAQVAALHQLHCDQLTPRLHADLHQA